MLRDQTPIQADCTIRPGGFVITDRAIQFCGFMRQARIADIGCGLGATVRHLSEQYGLSAVGLDKDSTLLKEAGYRTGWNERLCCGDALRLPFDNCSFDGLIYECSFSTMEPPGVALSECRRVLKPGGYWICSDLYARREAFSPSQPGMTGRFDTQQMIVERAEKNGFSVCVFEDYSPELHKMFGQMILDGRVDSFEQVLGVNRELLRTISCGYYLMIALNDGSDTMQVESDADAKTP